MTAEEPVEPGFTLSVADEAARLVANSLIPFGGSTLIVLRSSAVPVVDHDEGALFLERFRDALVQARGRIDFVVVVVADPTRDVIVHRLGPEPDLSHTVVIAGDDLGPET